MQEQWKPIKGYEGLYEISNFGRVKSNYTNKILIPLKDPSGYYHVDLCKNHKKKKHYLHRLVAIMFISNKYNYREVNHKDGNKENNSINNLEWCTRQYNVVHSVKTLKRQLGKTKQVQCVETGIIFNSITEAAKYNNISSSHLGNVINNKVNTKTINGLHWKFI